MCPRVFTFARQCPGAIGACTPRHPLRPMIGPIPLGRATVLTHLVANVLNPTEHGEDFTSRSSILGPKLAGEALPIPKAPVKDEPLESR